MVVDLRADRERLALFGAGLALLLGLHLPFLFADGPPLWLLTADAVALPFLIIGLRRAATLHQHTLVRNQGRLLLNGEPLELARVELRVCRWPLVKVPRGYALSLWVMTATGPVDLPIGEFKTMLEATRRSGVFEDFVQRVTPAQHRPLILK